MFQLPERRILFEVGLSGGVAGCHVAWLFENGCSPLLLPEAANTVYGCDNNSRNPG